MFASIALVLIVVAYRIASGCVGSGEFSWLHNFAPISAIALCGAVYLPRRIALALPLVMLLLSDIVLNVFHYHLPLLTLEMLPRYLGLLLIGGLGFALRGRPRIASLLVACVVGSFSFYLITNTGSWLQDAGYAKTFAGWIQALTTGLPGYPPTLTFYRNTLLSDVFFTLLFVGCMTWETQRAKRPVPADGLAPW